MYKLIIIIAVAVFATFMFIDPAEAARMGSRGPGSGDPAVNAAFVNIVLLLGVVGFFVGKFNENRASKKQRIQNEEDTRIRNAEREKRDWDNAREEARKVQERIQRHEVAVAKRVQERKEAAAQYAEGEIPW